MESNKCLLDASIGDMLINFDGSPTARPAGGSIRCAPLIPAPLGQPSDPASTWPLAAYVGDNNPFDVLCHRSARNRSDDPFDMASSCAAAFTAVGENQPAAAVRDLPQAVLIKELNKDIDNATVDQSHSPSTVGNASKLFNGSVDLSNSILNFSALNDNSLINVTDTLGVIKETEDLFHVDSSVLRNSPTYCKTNPADVNKSAAPLSENISNSNVGLFSKYRLSSCAETSDRLESSNGCSLSSISVDILNATRCSTVSDGAKLRTNSCTATCGDTSIALNTAFRGSIGQLSSVENLALKRRSMSCDVDSSTTARLRARLAAVTAGGEASVRVESCEQLNVAFTASASSIASETSDTLNKAFRASATSETSDPSDTLNKAFRDYRDGSIQPAGHGHGARSLSEPNVPHYANNLDVFNKDAIIRRLSTADNVNARLTASACKLKLSTATSNKGRSSSFSGFSPCVRRGSLLFDYGEGFIFEEAKELSLIFKDKAENYREYDSSDDDSDDILSSRPKWETSRIVLPDEDDDDVFTSDVAVDLGELSQANTRDELPLSVPALASDVAPAPAAKVEAAMPLEMLRPKRMAAATAAKKGPMRAVLPVGQMTKSASVKSGSPPAASSAPPPLTAPDVALTVTPLRFPSKISNSIGSPMLASTPCQPVMVTSTPCPLPAVDQQVTARPHNAGTISKTDLKKGFSSPAAETATTRRLSYVDRTPPRPTATRVLRRSTSAGGLPSPGSRQPSAPRQPLVVGSGYGRSSPSAPQPSSRRRSLPPASPPALPPAVAPAAVVQRSNSGSRLPTLAKTSAIPRFSSPAKPLAFKSPNAKRADNGPGDKARAGLQALQSLFAMKRINLSEDKENFQLA